MYWIEIILDHCLGPLRERWNLSYLQYSLILCVVLIALFIGYLIAIMIFHKVVYEM